MNTLLSQLRIALPVLGLLLCTGLVSTSCKQGEGDFCQVSDDCEDGLECNRSSKRCQKTGGQTVDAAPPADSATPIDSGTTDANVPDGSLVVPDASLVVPDASLVVPDASLVMPDASLVAPDASPK